MKIISEDGQSSAQNPGYNFSRRVFYRISRFFVYMFFRIYYLLKVRGLDNLPEGGGYILAVSHQSFFDPFLAGCPIPHFICFMARKTLWEKRYFRFLDFLFRNVIPLKRGVPDRSALKNAMLRLDGGWVILMFPEGTRTHDGSIGPIKKGPAFISCRTGAPVVPGVLKGAFDVWPRTRKLPRLLGWPFRRLEVRLGAPIRPEEFEEYSGREKTVAMTSQLEQQLHELFND